MTIELRGAHLIPAVWNHRLTTRNYWLRLDHFPPALTAVCAGAPPGVAPAWTINGAPFSSPLGRRPDECAIPRPAAPARIDVACRAGNVTDSVTLWCVRGHILFHTQGPASSENRRWAAAAREHHLPTGYRPYLGLHTWSAADGVHTNYGAWIEIVGIVEPPDVSVPFHLVRRNLHARTASSDSSRFPRPRADDTSDASIQDQTLSSRGRVYDLDAPGADFSGEDGAGVIHEWSLLMEQTLVIGPLQPGPAVSRAAAQHRVVSAPRVWRAYFRAFVRSPGAPPSVEISGYVGP